MVILKFDLKESLENNSSKYIIFKKYIRYLQPESEMKVVFT
jgi:hypothetical protein